MSNSMYTQFRYSKEKKLVDLFARITFGASGAPTLDTTYSKGIKSVTRTAAGTFKVTLSESFQRIMDVNHHWVSTTGTFPAAPTKVIGNSTVNTVGSPSFTLYLFNTAGALTDPASGDQLKLTVILRDSTAV